jgi:hypothetical protein
MLVLFNPSMEIQTNSNFVDWTSLSLVELTNLVYSSRSVPQGLEQDIDIATLNFTSPIWLTTPAKVKKLGVITKIITSIFDDAQGDIVSSYDEAGGAEYFTGRDAVSVSVTTLGNLGLLVLDGRARLIPPGTDGSVGVNWYSILDQYPGKFTADLSMIYTQSPDDGREMYGRIALDPDDETIMHVSWDSELRPNDYNITAIIDPTTYNPGTPTGTVRYLILEDININPGTELPGYDGPDAWKQPDQSDFQARANDIIEWTGTEWQVLFESQAADSTVYITNQTTGIQYTWTGLEWLKSFEGLYTQGQWRLVL